jgi:hypothetical protein
MKSMPGRDRAQSCAATAVLSSFPRKRAVDGRAGAMAVGGDGIGQMRFCGRVRGSETRWGMGLLVGMVIGIGGSPAIQD